MLEHKLENNLIGALNEEQNMQMFKEFYAKQNKKNE